MTPRRKVAYLLMVWTMLRHWLTGEYGLFDRILEFLVFTAIVYEIVQSSLRYRREKKRQKFLDSRKEAIHKFIERGNALLMSIPQPVPPSDAPQYNQAKTEWMSAVYSWSSETEGSLSALSAKARSIFLSPVNVSNPADSIFLPNGTAFYESDYRIRTTHHVLVNKIASLHTIMANPEAYF